MSPVKTQNTIVTPFNVEARRFVSDVKLTLRLSEF